MIIVDGYKAFHGTLLVTPKIAAEPFEIIGDWLYKPGSKCWYGGSQPYPEEICTIVKEDSMENPNPYEKLPDAECPSCHAELFDTPQKSAQQQRSFTGRFCEECIVRNCDNDANRILFLGNSNIGAAKVAAWITFQQFYGEITEFSDLGDAVRAFIKDNHDQDYFEWLMATN